MTSAKNKDGRAMKVTIMEALHLKHLNPQNPPKTSLVECDEVPLLENFEISSNHIFHVAGKIQGSAGPGGLDVLTGRILYFTTEHTVKD